jgi:hypothetical protein
VLRAACLFGSAAVAEIGGADLQNLGGTGYEVDGPNTDAAAGDQVDTSSNFNGDGIPDLVVGGPSNVYDPSRSGRVWLAYGKRDSAPIDLARLGSGGTEIRGPIDGAAVAGLGDVNRDGLSDVGVSAPRYAPRCRRGVGAAFVVFGQRDAAAIDVDRLGRHGYRIDGQHALDDPSGNLAGAGDINGDGRADLLAGTPYGFIDMGGGRFWVARAIFGRRPDPRKLAPARPPCLAARVLSTSLERALRAGAVKVRLERRDPRVEALSVEITDRSRSFFVGRRVRTTGAVNYVVDVPLDHRARQALESQDLVSLRLAAHEVVPRRRCSSWPRTFERCVERHVLSRFRLERTNH